MTRDEMGRTSLQTFTQPREGGKSPGQRTAPGGWEVTIRTVPALPGACPMFSVPA